MITFVGAGPGAEDLITVRGQNLFYPFAGKTVRFITAQR